MAGFAWAAPSAQAKYGGAFATAQPASRDDSQLPAVAGPTRASVTSPLRPSSGLFWFGVFAAAAVGLAAASTTVRVGPAKVAASLGG